MAIAYATSVVLEIAFVLEGETPEELPEQILFAIRLGDIDFRNARVVAAVHEGEGKDE